MRLACPGTTSPTRSVDATPPRFARSAPPSGASMRRRLAPLGGSPRRDRGPAESEPTHANPGPATTAAHARRPTTHTLRTHAAMPTRRGFDRCGIPQGRAAWGLNPQGACGGAARGLRIDHSLAPPRVPPCRRYQAWLSARGPCERTPLPRGPTGFGPTCQHAPPNLTSPHRRPQPPQPNRAPRRGSGKARPQRHVGRPGRGTRPCGRCPQPRAPPLLRRLSGSTPPFG